MRRVLLLPAVVVTFGALALTVVFAVIPAVSTMDYFEVKRGSNVGDLAILGGVEAGGLATGDLVATYFVDRPTEPYVVVGLQGGAVLLTTESGNVVILAPEAAVGLRVVDIVGGLGSVYGFVETREGWGTIAAVTVGAWLLTLLGLRTMGRRPERAFAVAERELLTESELTKEPVEAARPVAPLERPVVPEPALRDPIPFPVVPAAPLRPTIDDLMLDLAREVARQAPQAGLRHVRRVTELSTRKQTLGWAGLAATAAAVAAATYLVASERTQKREPKRPPRRAKRWL